MIIVNQIKLKPGFTQEELKRKVSSTLKILPEDLVSVSIDKLSIDARKKPEVFYVLNVLCEVKHEESVLRRTERDKVNHFEPVKYVFPKHGDKKTNKRPVIIGAGPCGLFAAYFLALEGYKPIVFERGFDVDSRTFDVENFWNTGTLNPNSNVLFGEGGAGTFSDGKLNTLVKDKSGRNRAVLETFVKFGAPEEILYDAKPHIGTDVLKKVVKNMREEIKHLGGEFTFNAEVTDIFYEKGKLKGLKVNRLINVDCDTAFLCIGHSARNTFEMLYDKGIEMEQKDFAVGFRVEHSQDMINKALYSDDKDVLKLLPPASYKLTYKALNSRGVYSFCMCPGGYVVNASSEQGRLCINGMSYSARDGENANSAIVVTVGKDDFETRHPLSGIDFQRKLEEKAYNAGNGSVPVQLYKDFKADVLDKEILDDIDINQVMKVSPSIKGSYSMAKVSDILPKELSETIIEGMEYFDRIIPGFAGDYTLLSAVESRTSSPVRILRDENFEALNIKGLYPCGEGAGYAGGITSAAMDGIKAAEKYASQYEYTESEV